MITPKVAALPNRQLAQLAVLALLAGLPMPALAGPVEVIYSITGHTPGAVQNNVPSSTLHFTNFNNRMFRSPNSNLWLVVPTTDGTPATADQVLIIGSGATGQLIAREGITAYAPGESIDFSTGIPVPRVSDSGSWVHAFTPQGVGLIGQRVVQATPGPSGSFTVLAQTSGAIPAIPFATYGTAFHSPNVSASGVPAFVASVDNASTLEAAFTHGGSGVAFGTFDSTPTNQPDGVAWSDIDTNLFYQDGTGDHSIARGKLNTIPTRDQVAVVDGAVVVQENVTTIGAFGLVTTISDVWMESDGTWFVTATAGGVACILRNGVLIANVGAPILPGSTELWSSFQDVRGNNAGEWVIVGATNNANTLRNEVAVMGRRGVLARESDPIDLDRDGIPETNLFIHSFRARFVLPDDGYLYFTIRAKSTAAGTSSLGANASFVRVEACAADFNRDGDVNPDDLGDFITAFFTEPAPASADFNADGEINPDDLGDFITAFFTPCH